MASVPGYDPNDIAQPGELRAAQPRPGRAAAQPRDAGRLPAGLDVQGRDRDRRDRQRASSRRTRPSTASNLKPISGVPLRNFGNENFGDDHAHRRADALGQHRLGAGRREARQARRWRSTWSASASTASRRSTYPADERRASGEFDGRQAASAPTSGASTSGAWRSARTSSASRRCRWRWSPPRSPTAAS